MTHRNTKHLKSFLAYSCLASEKMLVKRLRLIERQTNFDWQVTRWSKNYAKTKRSEQTPLRFRGEAEAGNGSKPEETHRLKLRPMLLLSANNMAENIVRTAVTGSCLPLKAIHVYHLRSVCLCMCFTALFVVLSSFCPSANHVET